MRPTPGPPRRAKVLCAVAAALLASGCRAGTDEAIVDPPAETSLISSGASPQPPGARPGGGRAMAVMRAWDSRRSAAFATDDELALSRLYVAGSPLASRDLAVLRAYSERGLRVLQAQQQVVSVEVHETSPRSVTVSVVERLAAARVGIEIPSTGQAEDQRSLPTSVFARRVLRFERTRGGWRLSWASEA